MTLTINVSPTTARRLIDDPQALRKAGEIVDAAFAEDETELTAQEWVLVDEGLAQIEAGRMKPYNRAEALARAEELLKAAGIS